MRILLVHPGIDFSVGDVHEGWAKALAELGCEVQTYNLADALEFYGCVEFEGGKHLSVKDQIEFAAAGIPAKCYEYQPDVVFVVSGFFVPDEIWRLWRARGQKTVLLVTESPYEDDKHLALVERVEPAIVLLNDPTNLDAYRDGKRRVYYFPHAFDPQCHHPEKVKPDCDFVFVGTGYGSRIEFLEQCDFTDLTVKLAGSWVGLDDDSPLIPHLVHDKKTCSPNAETVALYHSARVAANLYRGAREHHTEANRAELTRGWAMGPREVELAACGTFFLREPRGEGDLIFPMLPTFTEPAEFCELLRHYVMNPRARNKAARAACAAVQDRTFTAHAARFLRLLR